MLARSPEKRNSDLSASLDNALSVLEPVEMSAIHLDNACSLIDTVSDSLPKADRDDEAQANDGTIRDSDGFMRWVGERRGERARVAVYLALMAETGRISEAMRRAGVSPGLAACMRHRHPVFGAVEECIRRCGGRMLADRGREVVEDLMGDESAIIRVKSAGLALQYGDRSGHGSGVDVGAKGGMVQININLGECAPPPMIEMEQVGEGALFVPSR